MKYLVVCCKFFPENPSILCASFEFNGNSWQLTAGYLQKKRSHARHGPKLGELEARGQASSTGDMEDELTAGFSSRLM